MIKIFFGKHNFWYLFIYLKIILTPISIHFRLESLRIEHTESYWTIVFYYINQKKMQQNVATETTCDCI